MALTTEQKVEAAAALAKADGNISAAARALGLDRMTFKNRLQAAYRESATVAKADTSVIELKDKIRTLEAQVAGFHRETLDAKYVREKIIGLAASEPKVPAWLIKQQLPKGIPGVPCLLASDWHWGEVVDPGQIGGVNEFSLKIAHERARRMVQNTVDLLNNHMVNPQYPGIVFALGGDMITGDIHEELMATNEREVMPTLVDLWGVLVWCVETLADKFGKVFVPAVGGNHGRNTKKMRAKGRNFTSFDWLLYQFLAKRFESDARVTFYIPDGPDALFSIYGHRYLLTHGDQFRGGDALIGALGPIVRGDHRKRARNMQIAADYDTIVMGHWHQLMQTQRFIVNGCFPAGSRVIVPAGFTPIEDVKVGDVVLSRDGTTQTVTNRRETVSSCGLVHIKVRGVLNPLTATPNHMVWAIKGETKRCDAVGSRFDALIGNGDKPQWIPADYLSPGDYVHIPGQRGTEEPISADLAWAYGLYVAEGSALIAGGASKRHYRVSLTMHEREHAVLERFNKVMATERGMTQGKVSYRKRVNITSEYTHAGRAHAEHFRELFGHRANGKKLPDWMLNMTPDLKRAVVFGWVDGDGHTAVRKDGSTQTSVTTVSATLAHQMFQMALGAGLFPSMTMLRAGGSRRKSDSYTIHLTAGQEAKIVAGEVFYRIHARYRDEKVVPVFDLEVSGEHTFCVENVGVHNSLIGYNEYAYNNNFGFEPPRQALWITHPNRGITFHMPVQVDKKAALPEQPWIQWGKV